LAQNNLCGIDSIRIVWIRDFMTFAGLRKFGVKGILLCVLVTPFVILTRLLSPIVLIRYGNLRNHTIGTTCMHAETYFCDRELGHFHPRNVIDFFFHTEPRANREFDKLLESRLFVTPLARYMQAVSAKLPGHERHTIYIGTGERDKQRNYYEAYTKTKPHFQLSKDQRQRARRILMEKTGMPNDAKWICFFSRTSSYLRTLHKVSDVRTPEDFPVNNTRNSKIETYIPAAEFLCEQGYYAFRMGARVDEGIQLTNERVIDYANQFRSELLDLYLISECDLILSDTTGFCDFSLMFRRPTVVANLSMPQAIKAWEGLYITKKFWKRSENRIMSIQEIIETGGALLWDKKWDDYAEAQGIELIDNTSEEILDLVRERTLRDAGEWQDTDEDERLQEKYWKAFDNVELFFGGPIKARVATTFLRKYPELVGFN